ncbi:acyl-CoA synthetase [Indioceanicola profundi]|uniref:acyl-CoA synthetase n=1 Tax=Indioceanicola profundi TaxID=2220096 RepID=UPI000E6AC122|nr:acyl-CoA synthetase [Indioceanicola profundi]
MCAAIADQDLIRNPANFVQLSPLSLLRRTVDVHPARTAVRYGAVTRSYAEFGERCLRLAASLARAGIGRGDVVSIMAPNTPAHLEAHFGVAMAGAVLHSINIRLDAAAIAFQLQHGQSRLLLVDEEFVPVVRKALALLEGELPVVHIADPAVPSDPLGMAEYETFIAEPADGFTALDPVDEWDAITLNYTSGTTGNPKGVVYHHRGAYLNAVGNTMAWSMGGHPVYLWTLPMFHCNGWCFPWTITALAGTHVCLRRVEAKAIYSALLEDKVSHFCGAPIVLNLLANAPDELTQGLAPGIKVMTAGAAPPAPVIAAMETLGFQVTHVYGLTEVYGPCVVCDWKSEWDELPLQERARLKARQGVRYHLQEGLDVLDPESMAPVPADGATIGEVMIRGNITMKGYLKNSVATEEAFRGGWFHSGDLAVKHPDGYIELKDRSKDIIISGGENISTIEVEGVLYSHPAVLEAAVVARPDPKWGETPCAFVTLKPGASVTAEELIAYCRENLAHFKAPRTVVFSELPKTSTGKIQKFVLRDRAKEL